MVSNRLPPGLQLATLGYGIYETLEQSSQHHPSHCQSRYHDSGGEDWVQTEGKYLLTCETCSCGAYKWMHLSIVSECFLFTLLFFLKYFPTQVRKELEVNGIEFYPQKEFDEDLEDKTENDKIRVGCSWLLLMPCWVKFAIVETRINNINASEEVDYGTWKLMPR